MRKFGTKSDSPEGSGKKAETKKDRKLWLANNQRPIIAMAMIIILAFFLRVFFAYGVSSNDGYALSGGTTASEHLRTIVSIITSGTLFGVDGALAYPFGSVSSNPPLMDLVVSLFAFIYKACGMSAIGAASMALSWAAPIFGTLSVVAMYFLGKEVAGTKAAGYLSALFLALCPIVITQTVLSNGTEISFVALLFILMSYFLFKGAKALNADPSVEGKFSALFRADAAAMKYAAMAGILLALIALSWNGFRAVAVILIFAMAVQALVDRFRSVDVRPGLMYYGTILVIGVIVPAVYYIPSGLWDLVYSGVFIATVLAIVVCVLFALVQKKPWTATVPAFAIVLAIGFVILWFCSQTYFMAIVTGNSLFSGTFGSVASGNSVSLSQAAVDFGWATMWFGLIAVIFMIYRAPKNLSSQKYILTIVWMIVAMFFAVTTAAKAAVFAPAYAVGFAIIIAWVFSHVSIKDYIAGLKGNTIKTFWGKLFKPTPFITIVLVFLMVCAPNAMYAIDGSISSNESSHYNDQANDLFGKDTIGSINYYIKTDSDWKTNSVLSSYSGTDKSGALVTWIDYAEDAATYGGFNVIVDDRGTSSAAMANILLADATNGASTAAMIVYMMTYYGIDKSEAVLTAAGMTSADFATLKDVMNNPGNYRSSVLSDPTTYGVLSDSVSNENVMYLYAKVFITNNYSNYEISAMYDAICASSGKDISYFMTTGNMFPLYYGYSSVFSTLAYLNGYKLSDSYGTVTQFLTISYLTYYYGVYSFTDAMYNTLLWRTYIGMSPSEAGLTGTYAILTYINGLSLSDGTYKATPGYGLANYTVDYDHWYVMYNSSDSATLSSSGWTKMLYTEAIAKQESQGGLINYLSGMPVFLKYADNASGTTVSGQVTSETTGTGVNGVRVQVFDSNGALRSTVFTDADGKFTTLISDANSTIVYSSGSSTLTGGSTIATVKYDGSSTTLSTVVIPETSIIGTLSKELGIVTLKFVGSTTGNTFSIYSTSDGNFATVLVPDTYTITATSTDGSVTYATVTYLTKIGENTGYSLTVSSGTITVTLKDEMGHTMTGETVILTDTSSGVEYSGVTDSDGKAAIAVSVGTFSYSLANTAYTTVTTPTTIAADGSQSVTVTAVAAANTTITGMPAGMMATVYGSSYSSAFSIDTSGNLTMKYPAGTGGAAKYGVYAVDGNIGGTSKVYWCTTADTSVTGVTGYTVSGTLKNASGTAVAGTIVFYDSTNTAKAVSVTAGSDGAYSILLPEGTYYVYATDSSAYVKIDTLTVAASGTTDGKMTNDITMEAARKISGYTYYYSSTKMQYTPLTVTAITNGTKTLDQSLYLLSAADASYTLYIPSGYGCTITAAVATGSGYYYDTSGTLTSSKVIEANTTSSSANNFTSKAEAISVTNSTGYDMTVAGTSITAGSTADVSLSGTSVYVIVAGTYSGKYCYYSGSVPADPGKALTITNGTDATISVTEYYVLNITGLSTTDLVTITAVDDGVSKDKTTTGETRAYYLESGQSFLVKITDADKTKIQYYVTGDMSADQTLAESLSSDTADFSGYVGYAASGKVTITYNSTSFDVTVASTGLYSVTLPYDSSITQYVFTAAVSDTSDSSTTYNYTGTRTIVATDVSVEKTNTVNIAVSSSSTTDTSTDTVKASLAIENMTVDAAGKVATVKFKATVTSAGSITYALAGGSSWTNVKFYSDSAMTQQITAFTYSSSNTVFYGQGTIAYKTVAIGSNLSVTFTDLASTVCGTALFSNSDSNWVKTTATAETTKVNYGTDVVNVYEYKYAISLVNGDNYAKEYTLKCDEITGEWLVSFVYGNTIADWSSSGVTITVDGYTTETVYVKILTADGSQSSFPSKVESSVTTGESVGLSTADTTGGINVSGQTASVSSVPSTASVKVTDMSGSGRGVINAKSGIPMYEWVMLAAILVVLILLVWLGMRRGVFTRRK
jgi:asparagine N-glycosylation enzyme membrane subunit Stt3